MGAKQSSSSASMDKAASTGTAAPAVPLLPFGVVLQGLAGSGVSSVQRAASLPAGRALRVDERFLTSPPIYSTEWASANHPGFSFVHDKSDAADRSAWWYGGRGGTSAMWDVAAHMAQAVIFVVGSTDRARMVRTADSPPLQPESFVANYMSRTAEERANVFSRLRADMTAKETLHKLLGQHSIKHRPVLVLATKQDQPGAMPPGEIAALLGLPDLVGVDWRISGCNALTGEGIPEAMHWLRHVVDAPTDHSAERERERAEQDAARMQKEKVKKKPTNNTSATVDTQQSTTQIVESDTQPRASTPTPTATATPPSETNDDPAISATEEGQPEGQRFSVSITPTPNETNDLPVELRVEVVGHAEGAKAEGAEGAAILTASAVTAVHPFDSLSSTCVVMPALVPLQPEPVQLVRLKKHWYSRQKLAPNPNSREPFRSYQRFAHLVV